MPDTSLVHRILRKDWSVLSPPRALDSTVPGGAADLRPLLAHDDSEVRELALYVLNAIGGDAARLAMLQALRDPDEIARARAATLLHRHCIAADRPALESELRENGDEFVREHAALMLGELGDPAAAGALREQEAAERDSDARWGITLALARLGDDQALAAVNAALRRERPSELAQALQDFRYVGSPHLVPQAVALLQDRRDAVNVGGSHAPRFVRVCDVAVNALSAVLDQPFPFTIEVARRYSEPELAQAASIAPARAMGARPAMSSP
jgi:HEAT repeat protein